MELLFRGLVLIKSQNLETERESPLAVAFVM